MIRFRLTLFALFALWAVNSHAQTPARGITVNPTTNALIYPTAANFRTNNASAIGIKYFANGAALLAGTEDFAGQILMAADGGMSFGTASNGIVILNSTTYIPTLSVTTTLNADSVGTGLGHRFTATGSYCDNVISLANYTGGFAAMAGFRPQDAAILPSTAASFALGFGPGSSRGSPGLYSDRVYLGLAPKGTPGTADPPDFVIGGESDKGSGYIGRELLLFDGVAKTWTIRGWDNAAVQGPIGLKVAADGVATIGTLLHLTPRTAPGSPTEGDCYQSSSDHHLYVYNGTTWKQLDN